MDFNTSYVNVKPWDSCAYVARYVNFNTSYVNVKPSQGSSPTGAKGFQYILC